MTNITFKTLFNCFFSSFSGIILLTLCANYGFAATTAYQCIGDDGSISFWDKRPTEGCAKIIEVKTHVGKGSGGSKSSSSNSNSSSLSAEDRKMAEARDKELKEREKKAQEICDGKRNNLKTLQENSRARIKTEDGGSRYMTPDEHQNRIDTIKRYLAEACK